MNRKLYLLVGLFLGWGLLACKKSYYITDEGNLVPRTVESDNQLPRIRANNALFHAETFGNPADPMLVVLHGGPGSDYRYLLNCRAFASQGYFVIFYDQRGSGLSARYPKESYSLQLMIDDLDSVIAHYRSGPAQKVFLLGHSWGAMLATAFIDSHPDPATIRGAILCEPGGLKWPDIREYVKRSRNIDLFSETINDAAYLDQFVNANDHQHAVLDYRFGLLASADGAPDNPIGNEAATPFWRFGAVINKALFDIGERDQPDFTTQLAKFTTPVLFVYSEKNRAYGLNWAQRVSSAYSHVQLALIAGAGHDFPAFTAGWNNFYPIALNYLKSL